MTRNDIAKLLGIADPREVDEIRKGTKTLAGPDMQYRVAVAFDIAEAVTSFLPDFVEQLAWLKQSRPRLANRSIFDLMTGDTFSDLLLAKDFVDEFAGR